MERSAEEGADPGGFGDPLAALRQRRGLTQTALKVVDGFLYSFSPVTPRRRAAPPPRAKRKAS